MGTRKTEMVESALGSLGLLGNTLEKEMGLTCLEVERPLSRASSSPTPAAWDPQLPEPVGPRL